jgi:hypothetical protein
MHREKHAILDLLSILNAPGHPAHLDDYRLNVKHHNNPPGSILGLTANLKAYYLRTTVHAAEENHNGQILCKFQIFYNKAILNTAASMARS